MSKHPFCSPVYLTPFSILAEGFPSADILEIDIAPIQKQSQNKYRFECDDINKLESNRFDLIYGRCLIGDVDDWSSLLKKVYRSLVPGGFFEVCDRPIRIATRGDDDSNPWSRVQEDVIKLGRLWHRSFQLFNGTLQEWMKEAGFKDVEEIWQWCPLEDCLDVVLDQVERILLCRFNSKGVPAHDAEKFIRDRLKELEAGSAGRWIPWYAFFTL